MIINSKTYINSNELSSVSKTGAVVLYSSSIQEDPSSAVRKFIGAGVLTFFLGVLTLQAGWVYNAKALENPITSPITSQESPSPSASPSSNPITSPEVSPSPSNNNSGSNSGGNGGGNSGGGSSNSGGSVGAPSCNNEAPKSAPVIISAVTTGQNEVTLTWERAKNPVTHYVIAYGLQKGKPLYGNPNIGNVSAYAVKGLSGGVTYYFRIRAGNDCMPGPYSEEIAVKVGGKFIKGPAQNFKPGILGKSIAPALKSSYSPVASVMPKIQINVENGGLVGKVINFFKNWFN